jgi:cathepsin X
LIFALLACATLAFAETRKRGEYKPSARGQLREVTGPEPKDYIDVASLPATFDWRNNSGVNYLTLGRNQHIPVYCGSCWAHGTTSALNDRIKILRKAEYPDVILAPQHLINCEGGGDCDGGSHGEAYSFMKQKGIPDETCCPYQAVNGLPCQPTCKTCWPGSGLGNCVTITNNRLYHVDQFAFVSGVDAMKAEIYARGPIACGIDATTGLDNYKGGIYSEFSLFPMINHIISVTGWGVQDGTPYWIVRNSWGTYYGYSGFFYIVMGDSYHNLGIETDCYWATPLASDLPPTN